jgi:hypothetical protein
MTRLFAKSATLAAVVAAASIGSFAPFGSVAQAQSVCGSRESIIAQLKQKYGETRKSVGLQQGRGVVEIFASEETGSWTILVTDTRGHSCLMAAGEAFQVEAVAEVDTPT